MVPTRYLLASVLTALLAACEPSAQQPSPESRSYRNEVRFGLSFEERMAIPPALSRIRADAKRRAAEIYNPFRSREDAVRNEQYFDQLLKQSRAAFLASKHLTEKEAAETVAEYQTELGANLR